MQANLASKYESRLSEDTINCKPYLDYEIDFNNIHISKDKQQVKP